MRAVLAPSKLGTWTRGLMSLIERPTVLGLIPLVFLVLFLVGVLRAYTPVPTHDMWEGGLLGYFRLMQESFRWEFVSFWNEHRIVLSKLLFWLDTHFFGARFVFLTGVNLVLFVGLWVAFCAAARPLLTDRRLWQLLCAGLGVLAFTWMQRENVDSPFQSQFLLAYLVPLLAFLALAAAARAPERPLRFVTVVLLGVASLGTMANGLLVFPLLVVMQALLDLSAGRRSWLRLGVLLLCGAVLTALWFMDFQGGNSPRPSIAAFLTFVTTLLGFPAAYLTNTTAGGVIGGLVFIALGLVVLVRWWRSRGAVDPNALALLVMIAFVGGTAVLTAYGRAGIHDNAALVSRYATPSMAAWMALAILLAALIQMRAHARRIIAMASVVLGLIFFPTQLLRPLGDDGPSFVHGTMRAALAFKLGVADFEAISWAFPMRSRDMYDYLKRDVVDRLVKMETSIFADPMWDRAIAQVGQQAVTGFHACEHKIEGTAAIPDETRYQAVHGWVVDADAPRQPRIVYFAAEGVVVGFALRGAPRGDVADIIDPKGGYAGFDGYVTSSAPAYLTVVCPDA